MLFMLIVSCRVVRESLSPSPMSTAALSTQRRPEAHITAGPAISQRVQAVAGWIVLLPLGTSRGSVAGSVVLVSTFRVVLPSFSNVLTLADPANFLPGSSDSRTHDKGGQSNLHRPIIYVHYPILWVPRIFQIWVQQNLHHLQLLKIVLFVSRIPHNLTLLFTQSHTTSSHAALSINSQVPHASQNSQANRGSREGDVWEWIHVINKFIILGIGILSTGHSHVVVESS